MFCIKYVVSSCREIGNISFSPVPITTAYTESEYYCSNPLMWYERPQIQPGMKRPHCVLEPYSMADYYAHMPSTTAHKYMKPEPVSYYQYADDPERYGANITVSVQAQVHSTFPSTSAVAGYPTSTQYSFTSCPNQPNANPNSTYYSLAATNSSNAYSLGNGICSSQQMMSCSSMNGCSPVRTISEEAAVADPGMNTPLTPPLSVSPVPVPSSMSPTSSHSISPTTYLEKENTISYRSGTTSPCLHDCDSTTTSDLIGDGEVIPKLPLQMLSDLSEGLPLPGMWWYDYVC